MWQGSRTPQTIPQEFEEVDTEYMRANAAQKLRHIWYEVHVLLQTLKSSGVPIAEDVCTRLEVCKSRTFTTSYEQAKVILCNTGKVLTNLYPQLQEQMSPEHVSQVLKVSKLLADFLKRSCNQQKRSYRPAMNIDESLEDLHIGKRTRR